jgi:hypothetical protein
MSPSLLIQYPALTRCPLNVVSSLKVSKVKKYSTKGNVNRDIQRKDGLINMRSLPG